MYRRCEKTKPSCRFGMTLVELMVSMTIMLMIVGTVGVLAKTVQSTSEYSEAASRTIQIGRVCTERITRLVNEAEANQYFPGFLVISEPVGNALFPDTLVIWHPQGPPADPNGMPLFSELVVLCADPWGPSYFVEMTSPNDYRVVPPIADTMSWLAEIRDFKTSPYSTWNVLTDTVRYVPISSTHQGAVRFEARQSPSDSQQQAFLMGSLQSESVDWVQSIASSNGGLCQANLRFEIQLTPRTTSGMLVQGDAIPIFGSAATYYTLKK